MTYLTHISIMTTSAIKASVGHLQLSLFSTKDPDSPTADMAVIDKGCQPPAYIPHQQKYYFRIILRYFWLGTNVTLGTEP